MEIRWTGLLAALAAVAAAGNAAAHVLQNSLEKPQGFLVIRK